jgi:predicted metalloprotease with PDZ domain
MNAKVVRLAATFAMVLALPVGLSLLADEPTKEAGQRVEVQLDPELKEARVRLAEQIDQSVELNFLDVTSNLIAGNALGIDVAVPDASLQAQLGLAKDQGVVVTAVPKESQGASAGLKVHDLLLSIDGQGVGSAAELQKLLEAAIGKEVQLMLRRGGKVVELKTTLKEPQVAALFLEAINFNQVAFAHAEHYRIGVTLSEADDTLRSQLGLAAGEGLVVTDVVEGSPAAEAGIRTHDVFTMLGGKRLATVEAINAQIQEIKDKSVELRLLRAGKETTLRITPKKTPQAAFLDQPVQVWETRVCQECHQNPHKLDPHRLMGWKLGVNNSVWTDGHRVRLHSYENAFRAQTEAGQKADGQTSVEQQIDALKAHLGQMQKTLSALESTLRQPQAKEEKEEQKD